jgi:hypothetical protein
MWTVLYVHSWCMDPYDGGRLTSIGVLRETVNRSQMDIKHVIFEPGKNVYYSAYHPPTLIHLSITLSVHENPQHRSFFTVVSATSVSTWSSAKHLPLRWLFSGPNRWMSLGAKFGLLGLYVVWHCHYEVVPLLPVGLDVFCELHTEASTELHSTMQNSHLYHASGNGLTVLSERPQTR